MANFNSFKLTNNGLDLLYKAQTGKVLKFSKFVLGDGNYSGSIRDLTSLVSPVRNEEIKRLTISGAGNFKKLLIGFDLESKNIEVGFYLREIGIYAIDPDTNLEVLVYYSNSGDTADYISGATADTVQSKLINAELYISDVAEITAVIDDSMIYANKEDVLTLQNDISEIKNSYALIAESGYELGLVIDSNTYVMTLELKNKNGQVLSSKSIDFPLETMVVGASYSNGKLTLTLKNGTSTVIDISDMVSGLIPDTRTIAGVDLKDDITKAELLTALGIKNTGIVNQLVITNFWKGDRAAYEALGNYDTTTMYLVTEV